MKDQSSKRQNRPYGFAGWSIRFALFSALLAVSAVSMHRLEVVGFQMALPALAASTLTALLAALLGVIGLFMAMRRRESAMRALIGSLLGFVIAAPTLFAILSGAGVPRIHDITTDLDNPPTFEAIPALRAPTDNPLDRTSPENLAQLQREGYPGLKPMLLDRPLAIVFKQAVQLVKSRGWHIAAVSAEKGVIEATATTRIMGFKDDVVIRIQSAGHQTQVDMRSVSRVGLSDLGANAKRIQQFLDDLGSIQVGSS